MQELFNNYHLFPEKAQVRKQSPGQEEEDQIFLFPLFLVADI
jgi:hypothetical protein